MSLSVATKALLSSGLHPHYVSVAKTMAQYTGDTLDTRLPELSAQTDSARLLAAIDGETSCVVVQYPDILGRIEDLSVIAAKAHAHGALLIAVVTEPVALGAIKAPGDMGADIVRGSRLASACNLVGLMWGYLRARKNSSAKCPAAYAGRLWTRKASAASF